MDVQDVDSYEQEMVSAEVADQRISIRGSLRVEGLLVPGVENAWLLAISCGCLVKTLRQEQNAQEGCALVGPSGRVDRGWEGLWLPSGMGSHGCQRHHVTLGRVVHRQSHRITLTASILHGFAEETVFCMELQMV